MNPDATSTESIWKELNDELRRFLVARIGDRATADDLLQEVFVRIHRGLSRLKSHEHLRGWVYRIARNLIVDHHRRRIAELSSAEVPVDGGGAGGNLNEVVGGWLERMIDELPVTYREAVRLAELEDHSQAEIAARLGTTLTAAKSRIQRGRRLLREQLDACCALQFDRRGNVIDYARRRKPCGTCDPC
ncbi:MAG TPA: RNA polymerase sigma factor SigZ [Verrucomicrobiales bacterium]|nr:RNA polymerase sigma factor SigZ [Verrucomicrobiales bacterium]